MESEEPTKINPYNFNNKLLTIDKVKELFIQYDIIEEPRNLSLYQDAFVHKSYSLKKNEEIIKEMGIVDKPEGALELVEDNNERLEFFGDSIIGLVVAKYVFERFYQENEGFLTKIKTKLVRCDALGYFAKELKFGEYLIISRHIEDKCNGRTSTAILENTFEAFIGAMFLDFNDIEIDSYDFYSGIGFQICEKFLINLIEEKVDFAELIMNNDNHKDTLLKYFQKTYQQPAKFEVLNIELVNNSKLFNVAVYDINNEQIGLGNGSSKKKAEQMASKDALIKLKIIDEC